MVTEFINGSPVPLASVPTLSYDDFAAELTGTAFEAAQKRVLAYWKLPDARICCVLGNPATKKLEAFATPAEGWQPLTNRVPAVHRFERELGEGADAHPITPLKGEAAHEVAVGPVHAGVIEPGHFRFQCLGEDVHHLEIRLGYQHRGAEKLIVEAKNDTRRLALAETVAGDTSVAASLACAKALQFSTSTSTSISTSTSSLHLLLLLLLELERIANHVGDLGALAGDVAYLPTASFCGRIRGEYLNMTAAFCGNRFGRGSWFIPAPREETIAEVRDWFRRTERELFHALDLLFSEAGAVERFEGTGRVPADVARAIGLTGLAGRASGLKVDSRIDFPMAGEAVDASLVHALETSASTMTGDVLSRARQRYEELKVSHEIVRNLLAGRRDIFVASEQKTNTSSAVTTPAAESSGGTVCVAVVEAWRGELVHVAVRGEDGKLAQYKIVDPSYHNWFGLAQALRGEQISNFPICNKSFNLSYCGVDR